MCVFPRANGDLFLMLVLSGARLTVVMILLAFWQQVTGAQNAVDIKPSPQQVEWQDLEF